MCSQASSLLTRLMNHSILIHQCPYESSSYILITQFLCLLIYSNFLIPPEPSPPMGTPWSLNIFKYFISKNILHKLSTLHKHSYLSRLLIFLSPAWKCSDLIDVCSPFDLIPLNQYTSFFTFFQVKPDSLLPITNFLEHFLVPLVQ